MNPRCELLASCAERFESATERFERLVDGLSDDQASWRPAPKRWSVAECIEHLNVTAASYRPLMEPAVRGARERGLVGGAPYGKGTLLGRFILWGLDPEKHRRLKAPGIFRPVGGALDFRRVCSDFREAQSFFAEMIEVADGLDLGRIAFPTPVSGLFKVTAAQAFEIHSIHQLRHLAQAQAVIRDSRFPSESASP